jgi:hypothetical protein
LNIPFVIYCIAAGAFGASLMAVVFSEYYAKNLTSLAEVRFMRNNEI